MVEQGQAQREPELKRELVKYEKAVGRLKETFSVLNKRLEPVTRNEPSQNGANATITQEVSTPVGVTLGATTRELNSVCEAMENLLGRLEV